MAWSSFALVAAPYTVLPDAAIADGALTGLAEAVFFTSGSDAGADFTTTISFVRMGRDELLFSTWTGAGGKFVGWLAVVLTTLSRLCAAAEPVKHTAANTMHAETKRNFSKNFKTDLRKLFARALSSGRSGEELTYY